MMDRRRALMMAQEPSESWDFKWDYTQGKLEDNANILVDKSGAASTTMTSDGEQINTSSGYYQFYFTSDSPYKYMPNSIGVLEVSGILNYSGDSTSRNFLISCAQSSASRVTVYAPIRGGYWYIANNNGIANDSILTLKNNHHIFTLRIEMHETYADIYMDNNLVSANIPISSFTYGSMNTILATSMGSANVVLRSFKLKIGRLQ